MPSKSTSLGRQCTSPFTGACGAWHDGSGTSCKVVVVVAGVVAAGVSGDDGDGGGVEAGARKKVKLRLKILCYET